MNESVYGFPDKNTLAWAQVTLSLNLCQPRNIKKEYDYPIGYLNVYSTVANYKQPRTQCGENALTVFINLAGVDLLCNNRQPLPAGLLSSA
jgi:hypothetical protein